MKTKNLRMLLGSGIVVGGITVMSMTITFGGNSEDIYGSSNSSQGRTFSSIVLNKGISKDLQNELPTETNVANKIKNVKNAIVNITTNVTGISDIVSSNVDISVIGNNLTGLNLNYDPNKVVKLEDLKTELKDGFTTYEKLYCYLDSSSKYCKNLTEIVNNQVNKLSNLNDYFKSVVLFKYYSLLLAKEVTQKPVNGVCGTTTNICTSGTLVDIADTSTHYKWQCKGMYGGTTDSCSKPKPVNGVCKTSVNNGCSAGTLYDTSDTTTQYKWQCRGNYGGKTASCSKTKPVTTCNNSNLGKQNKSGQTCVSVRVTNDKVCIDAKKDCARDEFESDGYYDETYCCKGKVRESAGRSDESYADGSKRVGFTYVYYFK